MKISEFFTKVDSVSVDRARESMRDKGENTLLLDVREPAEYEEGHIPGAQFQPLSTLSGHLDAIDRSKKIITYCKRGPRSRSAAVLLKQHNVQDVAYMEGGIDAWNGHTATGQYNTGFFLLEGVESAGEIVAVAWSLEAETKFFYGQIAHILTGNNAAKQFFESLVKAEERHKTTILKTYRLIKGAEIPDEILRARSAEGVMESGVSVNRAVAWIKEEERTFIDLIEFSMQMEINSLDLYAKMLREITDEGAKQVFRALIEEEETHLKKLGEYLDNEIRSERSRR